MVELMKKYFIPNEHNEYKPHMLRKASLSILAFLTVLVFFAGVVNTFQVDFPLWNIQNMS